VRRLLAILTLAALGISALGTSVHEATERHAICAEHGMPVESGDGHGGDEPSSGGEHGHCAWAAAARMDAAPAPADYAAEIAPPPVSRMFQPVDDEWDFAVVRTYRLAPKTSPPAEL
jgi:hypothetical protein